MNALHKCRIGAFRTMEKMGIHVVPNHFYEPVPDTRNIPEGFWERPSEMIGIDLNEAAQLSLLEEFRSKYKTEYEQLSNPKSAPLGFTLPNRSFSSVDAEILYCMIRYFRPNRIMEIGSGNSTLVSAEAILRNSRETGSVASLIAVEPYPNGILEKGFPGLTRLTKAPVQSVPLKEFESLLENDILFIDSSHVLKTASDVQYEYLEIVPRVKKGVIVHFHDIFLPFSYPKAWVVNELRFWNEQYVLQALLAFNKSFAVLWAGNYMNHKHPNALQQAFDSYSAQQTAPGSFWIKRVS
jgi:hypothetical protein